MILLDENKIMIWEAQQQRRRSLASTPWNSPSNPVLSSSSIYRKNSDRTWLITVTTNFLLDSVYNNTQWLIDWDNFSSQWLPSPWQSVAWKYVQFYFNWKYVQLSSANIQWLNSSWGGLYRWESSDDWIIWAARSLNNASLPQISPENLSSYWIVSAKYWRIVWVSWTYQSWQIPIANTGFNY